LIGFVSDSDLAFFPGWHDDPGFSEEFGFAVRTHLDNLELHEVFVRRWRCRDDRGLGPVRSMGYQASTEQHAGGGGDYLCVHLSASPLGLGENGLHRPPFGFTIGSPVDSGR
jgi:hypothetical protein